MGFSAMSTDGIISIDSKYLHAPADKMTGCANTPTYTHRHTNTHVSSD